MRQVHAKVRLQVLELRRHGQRPQLLLLGVVDRCLGLRQLRKPKLQPLLHQLRVLQLFQRRVGRVGRKRLQPGQSVLSVRRAGRRLGLGKLGGLGRRNSSRGRERCCRRQRLARALGRLLLRQLVRQLHTLGVHIAVGRVLVCGDLAHLLRHGLARRAERLHLWAQQLPQRSSRVIQLRRHRRAVLLRIARLELARRAIGVATQQKG
mmetsp:Transcript_33641/g.100163  ORF Transcript_33641/g.100163 Transcript_33641/m.100163 type:complete len:207 (-) Transcript_33641:984-1604(-)